jgi:hypothetical protein
MNEASPKSKQKGRKLVRGGKTENEKNYIKLCILIFSLQILNNWIYT